MLKKSAVFVAITIAIILIVCSIYVYFNFRKVREVAMPDNDMELGIKKHVIADENIQYGDIKDEDIAYKIYLHKKVFNQGGIDDDEVNAAEEANVKNIALFGLDRRDQGQASRSDCIMILSVDESARTIKLSSIMRDTYVNVYGHGMTKITHAYAYGGPVLAVRTINENFQLDIRDFITVDFFQLEKLIDILGGVTIDVMPEEITAINENINETARIENKDAELIKSSGSQLLNGMQAVAYSRVRHTAGDDYKRTERQREVMQCILEKLLEVKVSKYPEVLQNMLPYIETSMDAYKILKLGMQVQEAGIQNIDKQRFPVDDISKGETIDGIWYLVTDLKATAKQINKYIYENIKP